MDAVKILGVPVHTVTRLEALDKIAEYIKTGKPHQVTTVNPEFVMTAQKNAEFRLALEHADLSLADGSGVMWAARYLNHYLPERIPGADLVNDIMARAEADGWRIYLIGGRAGVAEKSAARLQEKYPQLHIVGAEIGLSYRASQKKLFNEKEADEIVDRIRKARPDVLLVAFGAPKQDLFIFRYKKELGVPVMIGVGGTFDFMAGKVRRAPRWMSRLSLEWLWRLLQQPSRYSRIWTAVISFPLRVMAQGKD